MCTCFQRLKKCRNTVFQIIEIKINNIETYLNPKISLTKYTVVWDKKVTLAFYYFNHVTTILHKRKYCRSH